jgi:type VI secretion system protein ImpH
VFDRQHHIRLHIGPLRLAAFEDLLPAGRALPAVRALVQQYLGLEFGWDLRLELDKAELPPCRLGLGAGRGNRLGWTTWLGRPPAGTAAALDLVGNRLQS